MKTEISVSDIFHALLSHIIFILISALVVGALAFGITKAFIKPTYTASISLYAVSNTNPDTSIISISEQNASAQLANTYALILKSDTVLQEVSEHLAEQNYHYSAGQLKSMISTSTTDTQVFTVSVKARSGVDAMTVANTIYDCAPAKIVDIVGGGDVRGIDKAKQPAAPSSPNISSNTTVGVLIGLLLACIIVILRALTDTTIWTEEDLAKQFEVPILGTVPQLSIAEPETNSKASTKE